jgi:hypothetical protein
MLDNRWVVPYNPYLIRTFNFHINVEECSSIKSVKYLFKYIYKGHDRASVAVGRMGKNMPTVTLMRSWTTKRPGGWDLRKQCGGYTALTYTSVTHWCWHCNVISSANIWFHFMHETRLNEFQKSHVSRTRCSRNGLPTTNIIRNLEGSCIVTFQSTLPGT